MTDGYKITAQAIAKMTEQERAERLAPEIYVEIATGEWLDNLITNKMQPRMQIRKSLFHYLSDKISWLKVGRKYRRAWIKAGNLPPDWYFLETDQQFRERIKATLSGDA